MAKKTTKTDTAAAPAAPAETPKDNSLEARLKALEAWAKDAKERCPNLPDPPAS